MEKKMLKRTYGTKYESSKFLWKGIVKKREKTQLETITYHFFRPETAMWGRAAAAPVSHICPATASRQTN